ncbi:hypothetical protein GYMLUDRAFT_248502 [Collybiopsis luxurians FD-317 M1]|uniref:valine--tRNA ligase n=1 Tax=Collybiopsis luxurians FD-317 M1 TaxID=944289 RepID=A0A0D0CC83_9AGAR|nr:hypothetical protein GYMLUDRAFT_248502 [Collybiopsis luxurians FD-317 M1]
MSTTTQPPPIPSGSNNVPDPNSKSAAKKEAKRLEKEAKLAANAVKNAAVAARGGGKKAKVEKEKKDEEAPFVNTAPKGEKKDLSQPVANSHNPIAVQSAWYGRWNAQSFFAPQLIEDGKVCPEGLFVIPTPPPNTASYVGIACSENSAIHPGFNHAGISTQFVFGKRLFTSGKTRHDLGREKFARITNELTRLGGSYDWESTAFTMNPVLTACMRKSAGFTPRKHDVCDCIADRTIMLGLIGLECVDYDEELAKVLGDYHNAE